VFPFAECRTAVTHREKDYLARLFVAETEGNDLDGVLNVEGLRRCFRAFSMSEELVKALYHSIDVYVLMFTISSLILSQ